jgi:predicted nuclease of predicted toxin-antitoxin system
MASILRNAGLTIEVHDDHLPQDATDEEWLAFVGTKQWIVITRDERIRYRTAQRRAVRRAEVAVFVLAAQGDLRADMLAESFLKALPSVQRILQERTPPLIAKVSRRGEVTLLEV